MENLGIQVKKLLELAGFQDPVVNLDQENRKIDIYLNEGEWFKKWLPKAVGDIDHIAKLLAKRDNLENHFVDINNYRRERGRLIVELAKAAAKKATLEREAVRLPAMNAFERRLVHVELAVHPEVKTESEGEGKERCVIIKPIQ